MDPGVPNEACLFLGHRATSAALPRYLHDGTELRLILHLLLGNPPLDTGQDSGLEEVPPVVMEYPEKELKQLSLHVRGGALQRHTETLKPSSPVAQELLTAPARTNKEVSEMPGNSKLSASHPHPCPIKASESAGQTRSTSAETGPPETQCLGRCQGALFWWTHSAFQAQKRLLNGRTTRKMAFPFRKQLSHLS